MGNQECSGAKIKVIFSAWFFPFLQIVIKWHVGIRRFSLSSEMPKNRQSRRKPKAMIRKLQPRQRWCSPALCAGWVWGWSRNRKGFPFHVEILLPVISMMFCCLDKSCVLTHLGDISPSFLQSQMPDPKTFKQHFESKHPKSPLPPELEGVEA